MTSPQQRPFPFFKLRGVQFQRISPTQVFVAAPLEWAREAAWHSLWQSGVRSAVIDTQKNLVSGSTGDGVIVAARTLSALMDVREGGTLVTFVSKPVLGGTIDFGTGRKQAHHMAAALERIAQSRASWTPGTELSATQAPVAPIASPVASPVPFVPAARPVYGSVLAPKRGVALLVYSLLTGVVCSILAPFNLIIGFKALKDYREQGDPGDRVLVVAAMVVSAIVCVLVVAMLALL